MKATMRPTLNLAQYREDGPQLFAEAVLKRRQELGISRAVINRVGGPSEDRLNAIEHARSTNYNRKMLVRLANALGWSAESIERIIRGEEPEVINDTPPVLTYSGTEYSGRSHAEAQAAPPPASTEPSPTWHSGTADQQEVSREALYRMMMSLGRIYGHAMIMDVAGQVVADLAKEEKDPNR